MAHSFKPGDIALVIDGPARGHLVEVLSFAVFKACGKYCEECPCDHDKIPAHKIARLTHHDEKAGAPPHWLLPISDPDDREELTDELRKLCGVREDA